jgi:pimeloyl-ACP methyl ester carboxylesterase
MSRVIVNNLSIYYELHTPAKPTGRHTLLFLHGLGSSARDWQHQLDAFSDRYPVLLVDLRGHGQSDKPAGPWSIAQMAEDMAALVNYLSIAPVHVVGLSMGAQVGLQLALDHPDLVASITAVNSPADMVPRRLQDRLTVLQRRLLVKVLGMRKVGCVISARLFPGDDFSDVRKQFADRWAQNDAAAYQSALDAILQWDISAELHRIHQPLLVVAASDDYTPLAWKQRIVELAPDATLKIIEDSRHATPVERPDAFNVVLNQFLSPLADSCN